MKINRLETHDRLMDLRNQWDAISKGCVDCINNVPDSVKCPFYVYAHPRTIEYDEKVSILKSSNDLTRKVPSTRLIWSPRITKPKSQTNSYLFLANKSTDLIKIIWLLPPRELWDQYKPGNMTHNPDIWTSIQNFIYHREELEKPEEDGPTKKDEMEFRKIIAFEAQKKKTEKVNNEMMERLYKQSMQDSLEES